MLKIKEHEVQKPSVKIVPRPKKLRFFILAGISAIIVTKVYLLLFYLDPILGIYGFLTTFLVFSSFIISYTKYRDPTLAKFDPPVTYNGIPSSSIIKNRQPLVNIVIPAKNDPIMIRNAVRSCLESSYQSIEIILVNDGSTDNTGNVMDQIHAEYRQQVKVVHLSCNLGKRKATREGILNGNPYAEIIILIDSDCVIDNTAIENLVAAFKNPNVGAVCGLGRSYNPNNFLTKMQDTWYDGQFAVMKAMESVFGTVTCCPGILSAYRKEAILPCLDAWANDKFLGSEFTFGDDRHLTAYVIGGNKHYLGKENKVWKAVFSDRAIVYTEMPTNITKFIRQQIRWKKSWFRVFFFTVPFYFKDRNLFAASIFYLQMIWSFLSPVIAIRSLVYLPLQGQYIDALVYLSGLAFIGLLFAADFKMRNPSCGKEWMYRPLWSLMGFFLSSLRVLLSSYNP